MRSPSIRPSTRSSTPAPARRGAIELGTWIHPEVETAYTTLHDLGYAHSVEAWEAGALVGGLYGVLLGRCFFGESMFSLRTDASKVALVALAERLASPAGPPDRLPGDDRRIC